MGKARLSEDEFANRVIYPQVVPVSLHDQEMDLAILREVLKFAPEKYYKTGSNKINLSSAFLERFPSFSRLIWAYLDVFQLPQITSVTCGEGAGVKGLGTILKPQIFHEKGVIEIWINQKKYQAEIGSLTVLPAKESKVDIHFESVSAKMLSENSLTTEVAGGKLGLVLDLRLS